MFSRFISATAETETMSLGNAALYAVVGFVIVLAVLALLVGIFYLMGAIFRSKLFNRPKKDKKDNAPVVVTQSDNDEIVAAITAAVSVMLESECEGEAPEFVIRRITRNNKKVK